MLSSTTTQLVAPEPLHYSKSPLPFRKKFFVLSTIKGKQGDVDCHRNGLCWEKPGINQKMQAIFFCLQTSLHRGRLIFLKYLNLGNSVKMQSKMFPLDYKNDFISTDQYYEVATTNMWLWALKMWLVWTEMCWVRIKLSSENLAWKIEHKKNP